MRRLGLSLFSHRTLAVARWDLHFIRIRFTNVLRNSQRKAQRFIASRSKPVYVNLGSGPRGIDDPHWINVDGFDARNVHFVLDFNRPLPFADASLDGVFCEHVLEHFSLADGERLMREVRRCLRPGAAGRLIVPDASRVIQMYFSNPEELVERRLGRQGTAMEAVNSLFRQHYEHQFLYDWTTLNLMLERAGFRKISRSTFGTGDLCPALVLDDPKYEWESLYVEVQK